MNALARLPRLPLPPCLAALALLAGAVLLRPSLARAAGPTYVPGGTVDLEWSDRFQERPAPETKKRFPKLHRLPFVLKTQPRR